MTFHELIEAFNAAGYEPRSYSGRGMYGVKCLAVTCENPANMIRRVIKVSVAYETREHTIDLIEDLNNPQEDSMGTKSVVYWPGIRWEGPDTVDAEEDE